MNTIKTKQVANIGLNIHILVIRLTIYCICHFRYSYFSEERKEYLFMNNVLLLQLYTKVILKIIL
jgi:hypothetical protein